MNQLKSAISQLHLVKLKVERSKMIMKQKAKLDDKSLEKDALKLRKEVLRELNKLKTPSNKTFQMIIYDLKQNLSCYSVAITYKFWNQFYGNLKAKIKYAEEIENWNSNLDNEKINKLMKKNQMIFALLIIVVMFFYCFHDFEQTFQDYLSILTKLKQTKAETKFISQQLTQQAFMNNVVNDYRFLSFLCLLVCIISLVNLILI